LINGRQSFLYAAYEELKFFLVLGGYQVVLAQVLIAAAAWVTLVETEYFINGGFCPLLEGYHWARPWTQLLVICRVLKFPVELVARTLAGVLTAVKTVAERLSLDLLKVLPNIVVYNLVLLDILNLALGLES